MTAKQRGIICVFPRIKSMSNPPAMESPLDSPGSENKLWLITAARGKNHLVEQRVA